LRQAWELSDAAKAERLIHNLARRLEYEAPGVSGSILEGIVVYVHTVDLNDQQVQSYF
jgi:hypothetical protein